MQIVHYIVCSPFCGRFLNSSVDHFIHYIVHYKIPTTNSKFQCTNDVPYILLQYATMQCGCVFLKEKKK